MFKKILLTLLVLSLILVAARVSADDNLTGYAWSSNIGWIKLDGANYGLRIPPIGLGGSSQSVLGHAWSSNIGWINFAPGGGYPAAPNHGAKIDSNGALSGWARALSPDASGISGWDGWIKLAGANYGVQKNANNTLSGWAWGNDVIGWIKFVGNDTPEPCDPKVDPDCGPTPTPCSPFDRDCPPSGNDPVTCRLDGSFVAPGSISWRVFNLIGGVGRPSYHWRVNGQTYTSSGSTFLLGGVLPNTLYNGEAAVVYGNGTARCSFNLTTPSNPGNPGGTPTLSTISSQDRISILNQSLSSPAISNSIGIMATGGDITTALQVRVLSINSVLDPSKSLLNNSILNGSGNQELPKCRLKGSPINPLADPQVTLSEFVPCASLPALPMSGVDTNDKAYFNIRVHRPVQALNNNSPYSVVLGDGANTVKFLFEYNVGTVNPV